MDESNGRTWAEVLRVRDNLHRLDSRVTAVETEVYLVNKRAEQQREAGRTRLTLTQLLIGAAGVGCAVAGLVLSLVR